MAAAWEFPRQAGRRSLASPTTCSPSDHVALFVTTAGEPACASASRSWKASGEYLKSHALRRPGARDRRGRGRVAAPQAARRLGLPRSARDRRSQRPALGALPRQALQLRLSRLSGPRRPARAVRGAAAGGDRRRAHRGRHDGPRGERLGDRLPPPRRAVLRRVRRRLPFSRSEPARPSSTRRRPRTRSRPRRATSRTRARRNSRPAGRGPRAGGRSSGRCGRYPESRR